MSRFCTNRAKSTQKHYKISKFLLCFDIFSSQSVLFSFQLLNIFLTTPFPIKLLKTVYFLFSKRRRPAGIEGLICCPSAKFLIASGVEEIVKPEVFQIFIGISISLAYVSASFSIFLLISFVMSSK